MLNQKEILSTIAMIDQQHLDIRTITMGISLRSQPHRQDRLSAETTMVPSMSRLTAPAMCRRLAM